MAIIWSSFSFFLAEIDGYLKDINIVIHSNLVIFAGKVLLSRTPGEMATLALSFFQLILFELA